MAKSFEEIIGNAQRLMLDENWNRQVDMSERMKSGMQKRGGGGISSDELKSMEASIFGFSSTNNTPQQQQMVQQPQMQYQQPTYQQPRQIKQPRLDYRNIPSQVNEEQRKATYEENLERFPEALRESFKKTPPISGDAFKILTEPEMVPLQETTTVQQPQAQAPVSIPTGGAIDYGVIKAIVNECLRENRKSMLNEGLTAGLRIKDGNVISFVDKKGNVFEGVLKLKKKAASK